MERRKLPLFNPAGSTSMGRKRKGHSLPTLSACKHCRIPEVSGWASLSCDLVHLIASRLLAGDVVDYISFRAVCYGWRACTHDERDPTLRKSCFRPRGWVALCDGDAVRPDDACEITFFHTRTGRCLPVRLPELQCHRIIGFTDGLVILLHKRTIAIRVVHPFTRVVVDLPSLVPVFHEVVRHRNAVLDMNATVCSASATSIAVVVWFPYIPEVLAAGAGRTDWEVLNRHNFVSSVLPFQGKLYATFACSTEIIQLYPRSVQPVLAYVPTKFGERRTYEHFLVESGGQVLLAIHHSHTILKPHGEFRSAYNLYAVDVNRREELTPVSCISDRALFLGWDRCLSVSSMDLPSVSSNSVYISVRLVDPVVVHPLKTGCSERLGMVCQIHDGKERIRPSVRPFTIVDHLITYCHPREWTKGLMYHEYHSIPESFKELKMNIKAKDSQLRIPRVPVLLISRKKQLDRCTSRCLVNNAEKKKKQRGESEETLFT